MHNVLKIVGDASDTMDMRCPRYWLIEGGYKPVVVRPAKRRFELKI